MPRSEQEIMADLQQLLGSDPNIAPQQPLSQNAQVVNAQPPSVDNIPFKTTKGTLGGVTKELDPIQMAIAEQQALLPGEQEKKLLKQPMSDTALEKITDYDNSILSTDNVIEMWNQNGGFETGPAGISNYSGTIGELARQFNNDPAFSSFYSEAEKMFQQFRKIVTGAQASDRELRMLRPLIAKTTDRPQIFIAKALASREIARVLQSNYVKRQDQSGRDISGFRDISTPDDIEFAKQSFENALLRTGMDDSEAQKLVEDAFGRTSKLVAGRKTLKGTPLDISGEDTPGVESDLSSMSDDELRKLAGL